jgi:drug/metabolite transporter (DMT)-like permease
MENPDNTLGNGRPISSTAPQYAALALVWGSSFLLMRLALKGLSPAQVAIARLVLGGVTLALIMTLTKRSWPREPRTLMNLTVVSVLLGVFPFLLYAWAGQYLPSGLSSIYNATTPIMTLLVAVIALPDERLTRARSMAFGLAALGVVALAAPWRIDFDVTNRKQLLAQLACLGATACYGAGFVYMRRFIAGSSYDTVTIAATQIGIGAVIMLCLSPVIGRSAV